MRILVLGATGDQGLAQVSAALDAGHEVRGAARSFARVPAALRERARWVHVDFSDRRSLAAAMAGVDVVLGNFPSSSFNDGSKLIAAAGMSGRLARESGVELIVFNTSLPMQAVPLGCAAHDVRLAMHDALIAGGAAVITVQPVVFMDNLLRGWAFPHIADRNRFVYPHAPDLEVSWICQSDLAQLMLAAAVRPQLSGRRFAVGGPEAIRGADVARALSAAAGRPIEFEPQSIEEFCVAIAAQMNSSTLAERDRMIGELAKIYRWYNESPDRPFRIDMAPVLRELPVSLKSLPEWALVQRWHRQ